MASRNPVQVYGLRNETRKEIYLGTSDMNKGEYFNRLVRVTPPLLFCWDLFGDDIEYVEVRLAASANEASRFVSDFVERLSEPGWTVMADCADRMIRVEYGTNVEAA